MNRYTIAVAGAMLLGMALTGCAASTQPADVPSETSAAAAATPLSDQQVCDEWNAGLAKLVDPKTPADVRAKFAEQMASIGAKASGDLKRDIQFLASTATQPSDDKISEADERIGKTCKTLEYLGIPTDNAPTAPPAVFQSAAVATEQMMHLTHRDGYKVDITVKMYEPVDVTIEDIRSGFGDTCFKRLGSPNYPATYKALRVTTASKNIEVNGFSWPAEKWPEVKVYGDGKACGSNIPEAAWPLPIMRDGDMTVIYQAKKTPNDPQGTIQIREYPEAIVHTGPDASLGQYDIRSCTIEGQPDGCVVKHPAVG